MFTRPEHESLAALHAFHGDVASAQLFCRAVPHFQLQLGVVAKRGEVVRGEGVPQHIRLPGPEASLSVQA